MGRGFRVDAKRTAESCFSIDIHWLKKKGYLPQSGMVEGNFTQTFRVSRRKLITTFRSKKHAIQLEYKWGEETLAYTVPVIYSECNYGGKRPWFQCPNQNCNKRVGKLFLSGKYYLCRHCHNLAYETQNMNEAFRMLEKAQKIRERLGAESLATVDPLPFKPKGMHSKTYANLQHKYWVYVDYSWGMAAKRWGVAF
jgi:hypothetical protein